MFGGSLSGCDFDGCAGACCGTTSCPPPCSYSDVLISFPEAPFRTPPSPVLYLFMMISLKALAAASTLTAAVTASAIERRWATGKLAFALLVILFTLCQSFLIYCFHAYVYPYLFSPMKNVPMPDVSLHIYPSNNHEGAIDLTECFSGSLLASWSCITGSWKGQGTRVCFEKMG